MANQRDADVFYDDRFPIPEYFYKLCDIVSKAEEMTEPILTDEDLESLSVRRLHDLDVDTVKKDHGPRYYEPMAKNVDRSLAPTKGWFRNCLGKNETGFPTPHRIPHHDTDVPGCDARDEVVCRKLWFKDAVNAMRASHVGDSASWKHTIGKRPVKSYAAPDQHFSGAWRNIRKDGLAPHILGLVGDTYEAGLDILRSEVLTAANLLKEQARIPDFKGKHRILPLLLFGIQHDSAARITQVHFDGNHLYFRQSRPLSLVGDSPTPDAFLMLRWLASQPIGNTSSEEAGAANNKGRYALRRIESNKGSDTHRRGIRT